MLVVLLGANTWKNNLLLLTNVLIKENKLLISYCLFNMSLGLRVSIYDENCIHML